jgi:hypothetical protein
MQGVIAISDVGPVGPAGSALIEVIEAEGEPLVITNKTVNVTRSALGAQATITGAASTITTNNLTTGRAVISDGSGKVAVSAVTSTELGHVAGVTGGIQGQLNAKAPLASPTFTGQVGFTPTTLATTGTVNIDFAGATYQTQASLTGNITYTGSNYQNGRSITIRVINGATQRTLAFPAGWRFVGEKPANIAADKVAILTVAAFGSNASDVVAGWAVEV